LGSPTRRARDGLLVAITTATLIGCTQVYGLPVDESATGRSGPVEPTVVTHVVEIPDVDPDPSQAEVLADGSVSAEEYRQTVDRYVACLADGGVEAHLTFDNDFEVAGGFSGRPPGTDGIENVTAECSARFFDAVDAAAADEHSWDILLDRATDTVALRSCLLYRGHDVAGLTEQEILDAMMDAGSLDLYECHPDEQGPISW
jgi:hypothetical protein